MGDACTDCGLDIHEHDPVYVETRTDGDREPAGRFCNYACLAAHIESESLTAGASCWWIPPSS